MELSQVYKQVIFEVPMQGGRHAEFGQYGREADCCELYQLLDIDSSKAKLLHCFCNPHQRLAQHLYKRSLKRSRQCPPLLILSRHRCPSFVPIRPTPSLPLGGNGAEGLTSRGSSCPCTLAIYSFSNCKQDLFWILPLPQKPL